MEWWWALEATWMVVGVRVQPFKLMTVPGKRQRLWQRRDKSDSNRKTRSVNKSFVVRNALCRPFCRNLVLCVEWYQSVLLFLFFLVTGGTDSNLDTATTREIFLQGGRTRDVNNCTGSVNFFRASGRTGTGFDLRGGVVRRCKKSSS